LTWCLKTVESNYGTNFGKYPLIQSLGTLSCFGRRKKYFRTEWLSTLRILQNGDIAKEQLKGSWAGAFGNTQFMPSTFEKFAIDFDGDGKRDLINSIPDALASTANFVSKSGWVNGMEWGIEVKIPKNIEPEGRHAKHDVIYWKNKGVTLINGASLPSDLTKSGLLTIAGVDGPAFLVTKNFDAIYRYNAAESYALAISHLSDRLRGYNHFITPWPTDDAPLTFTQKKELQSLLMLKGYDIGEIDGRFGEKICIAIKSEQLKLGQDQSGRAGQKLFATLNKK
jgi:lytic murein transglycosylase